MKIDDEAIEDLRRIYRSAFHEELTVEDAREKAVQLMALYEALAQPLPSEDGGRS